MRRWAQNGHRVAVVSGRTSLNQEVGVQYVDGVEVYTLRTLPTQMFKLRKFSFLGSRGLSYVRSMGFVPRGQWDIIRDDLSPLPSFYPFHAKRAHVPSVVVVHILYGGLAAWAKTYGPMGVLGALGEAALIRGWLPADHIISASGWLADDLREQTRTAVDWIPNGVDTERFAPGEPTESPEQLSILSVGRFGPMPKGQSDLVKAVSQLAQNGIQVQVTFIGEGPERSSVEREARALGLEGNCKFVGAVKPELMPDQYRSHQVFVLSSYVEGLPLTFLEAMATGLAIVSTDIIAVRELAAASRALLYQPGDVGGLARNLEQLINFPEQREAMGQKARDEAIRQFTWDETAAKELKVFEDLIREQAARI